MRYYVFGMLTAVLFSSASVVQGAEMFRAFTEAKALQKVEEANLREQTYYMSEACGCRRECPCGYIVPLKKKATQGVASDSRR